MIRKFIIPLFAFGITLLVPSCSSKKDPANHQEQVKESYRCPMKCSDEIYTKPGHCPVCNMELEKVNPS